VSRVLLTDVRPEALQRAVEEAAGRGIPWADAGDPDLDDVDVWFCAGPPPGQVLTLPNLQWIHSGWAGVEGWFRRPEWRRGVRLTRTVGDFPERMAEYVFAYLLAQELGVARAIRQMQNRAWRRWVPGSIQGRSMLVVGYGAIGSAIAARARAFGLQVQGIRRGPVTSREETQGVHELPRLPELIGEADIIVNVLPHTRATESFWNRARFESMAEGAVFVSISRGATVDEGALLDAIRKGRPGRAILDVFREEPLPPDHPLRGFDEIWITPHVAGTGTVIELARDFAANWSRYQTRGSLLHVVDRERGY
jgi:phosphoglycerate dehydrogenase-like enzyme